MITARFQYIGYPDYGVVQVTAANFYYAYIIFKEFRQQHFPDTNLRQWFTREILNTPVYPHQDIRVIPVGLLNNPQISFKRK